MALEEKDEKSLETIDDAAYYENEELDSFKLDDFAADDKDLGEGTS